MCVRVFFLDLVRFRSAYVLLDFRFLLHTGVSDGSPSELREEIFHPHRPARLRFLSVERHRFRKSAGRRGLRLRTISRRGALQYDHNEARRVLPKNPLRHRALRKSKRAIFVLSRMLFLE